MKISEVIWVRALVDVVEAVWVEEIGLVGVVVISWV